MLYPANSLPFSSIDLDEWLIVKVSGADALKFLQGQVTAEMADVTEHHYLFAAHCDPKGKVWANIILFKRHDDFYYLIRKSIADIQIKELKKYAVFSKVTINIDDTLEIIGLAGQNMALPVALATALGHDNNYCLQDNISCLQFKAPSLRYLLIGDKTALSTLNLGNIPKQPSSQWTFLDMQAGYPVLDEANINQHLPQAINLQHFDAIDFQKGCYCGQEMVARAQYRGINKRSLFLLTGHATELPIIGESLSLQLGENWRDTGTVLAAIKLDNSELYVQAILNTDIEPNSKLRVKNDPESELSLAI